MDIFTPKVPTDRLHPYFQELISGRHGPKIDVLSRWMSGFVDRDGKFDIEFQTTFNSAFWELYLHAAFSELGAQLDYSTNRPDFAMRFPEGQQLVAEAVIASNANDYLPEWQTPPLQNAPLDAMLEYSSLRLANAFSSKLQKYRTGYAALPHVKGKPFVVCIAPFEQRGAFTLADRAVRRVLFGVDMPLVEFNPVSEEFVLIGEAHCRFGWKPSGAAVPFGMFLNDSCREISAVIFSNTATFGKLTVLADRQQGPVLVFAVRYNEAGLNPHFVASPIEQYHESLLDGLHIFVNPFAERPIDTTIFSKAGCAIHTMNGRASA